MSPKVLHDVAEELLFYIRTSMAAGRYETAKVSKVIYIESLSELPMESNVAANANIVWKPESEGGTNSTMIGILFTLLALAMIGITLLVYVTRRRRVTEMINSEKHTLTEMKPDDTVSTLLPPSTSTEEVWKKALDTEKTWRNALSTYADTSSGSVGNSEEEANTLKIENEAMIMEVPDEQMVQGLENRGDNCIAESQVNVDDESITYSGAVDGTGFAKDGKQQSSPIYPPEGNSLCIAEDIQQHESADNSGNKENSEHVDVAVKRVGSDEKNDSEEEQQHHDNHEQSHHDDQSLDSCPSKPDGEGDNGLGNQESWLGTGDSSEHKTRITDPPDYRETSPASHDGTTNRVEELD
jgi:hypothetical protein